MENIYSCLGQNIDDSKARDQNKISYLYLIILPKFYIFAAYVENNEGDSRRVKVETIE